MSEKVFLRCGECGELKGCRKNSNVNSCKRCAENIFNACCVTMSTLKITSGQIKAHLCVLCAERHDALIPHNFADDDYISGCSSIQNY